MKYSLDHIKEFPSGGGIEPLTPINIEYFETAFYQPFEALTFSCDQMNKKVCQVRAAIETLNRYVSIETNLETGNTLAADIQAYCLKTYSEILIQLGTSFEELRNVQNGTSAEKAKLAERLNIPYAENAGSELTNLFLNNDSTDMTQANIEQLFGIVDTERDPFCDGLKENDVSGSLKKWYFNGYQWGLNTDEEGFIYLKIDTTPSPDVVEVYMNEGPGGLENKIAEGFVDSTTFTVKLSQYNQSGLTGILQLKTGYTEEDNIRISLVPRFLSWQFKYLYENIWKGIDYKLLDSNYIDETPCIDPDVVSLEDLQNPNVTSDFVISAAINENDTAANIWNKRNKLLSDKKGDIKEDREDASDSLITTETLASPVAQTIVGNFSYVLNKTAAGAGTLIAITDLLTEEPPPLPDPAYLPIAGSFSNPEGITHYMLGVDPIFLIADTGNNQIKRRDSDAVTTNIGTTSTGTKLGLFNAPKDVTVDTNNNLIVADSGNNRIQVLNMGWLNKYKADAALTPDGPKSIKTDKYGNVYIADTTKHRILKYGADGLLEWNLGKVSGGTPVAGTGDLEFDSPLGIAVDNEGNIYVSDTFNDRIQKIGVDGEFKAKWGSAGAGDNQLQNPVGITFHLKSNGDRFVAVADTGNSRIQVFNQEGEYLHTLGTTGVPGDDDEHFNTPVDVAFDKAGNCYVADQANHKIKKYNNTLSYVGVVTWSTYKSEGTTYVFEPSGIYIDANDVVYISVKDGASTYDNPAVVRTTTSNSTSGSGDALRWGDGDEGNLFTNQLSTPLGLCCDAKGFVFVADGSSTAKIHKFRMPYAIGSSGSGDGQLSGPTGITLAADGTCYVADSGNNRVQQFRLDGTYIRKWNTKEVDGAPVTLSGLYKIYADSWGYVYITENNGSLHAVHKYEGTGKYLRTFTQYVGSPTDFLGTSSIISTPDNQNLYITDYVTSGAQKLIKINQLYGLGAAVSTGLGTTLADLVALRNTSLNGEEDDFEEGLEAIRMNKVSFNYLMNFADAVNRVPVAANILDSEWDTVYDILVRSYKLKNYYLTSTSSEDDGWKRQEEDSGIVLSPRFFKVLSAAKESEVILNPWRTLRSERKNQVKELKARLQQMEAAKSDLEKLTDAVQDENLRALRDALIIAAKYIRPDEQPSKDDPLEVKAYELGRRLFIDFKNNCCSKTTRVAQAMEVVQGIMNAVRSGIILDIFPLLTLDSDYQDEQWIWIGSYEKWRAGMFVSLYPENILLPQLKEQKTSAFKEIIIQSSGNLRFNPTQAKELESNYRTYTSAILNLKISSLCLAFNDSNKEDYYFFANSSTSSETYGTVYWASSNQEKLNERTAWEPVPGTNNKVKKIIGSEVFRNNKDERHVYLFIRVKSGVEEKFAVQRYNLSTLEWDDEYTEIGDPLGAATIIMRQRYGGNLADTTKILENQVPEFAIAINGKLVLVSLTRDGMDVEEDPVVVQDVYKIWRKEESSTNRLLNAGVGFVAGGGLGAAVGYKLGLIKSGGGEVEKDELYPLWVKQLHAYIKITDVFDIVLTHHCDVSRPASVDRNNVSHTPYAILTNKQLPGSSTKIALIGLNKDHRFVSAFRVPATKSILSFWMNKINGSVKLHVLTFSDSGQVTVNTSNQAGQILDATKAGDELSLNYIKPYRRQEQSDSSTDFVLLVEKNNKSTLSRIKYNSTTKQIVETKIKDLHLNRNSDNFNKMTPSNRAANMKALYEENKDVPVSDIRCLDEYFYFVPIQLALQLQKRGFYQEALDRYRLIYDYTQQPNQRKVYYGLVKEASIANVVTGSQDWINSPLNPHAVAVQRANSYTRFTLLSIARCFIEYGDSEFTMDNAETNPRARTFYEFAISLLKDPVLTTTEENDCKTILKELNVRDAIFTSSSTLQWNRQWLTLKEQISQVKDKTLLEELVNDILTIYIPGVISDNDIPEGLSDAYTALVDTIVQEQTIFTYPDKAADGLAKQKEACRLALKAEDGVINNLAQRVATLAADTFFNRVSSATGLNAEFLRENTGTISFGHSWLNTAVSLSPPTFDYASPVALITTYDAGSPSCFTPGYLEVNSIDMLSPNPSALNAQVTAQRPVNNVYDANNDVRKRTGLGPVLSTYQSQFIYCIPNNPVKFYYSLYAEMNLFKLRNCMNIAGVQRELDPYAAPTDTTSGLPYIGIGGQIQYAGTPKYNPSIYRYEVLIERAKQLGNLAQQMESAMLASLEKRDAEDYSRQKAKQELQLGRQNVKLNNLRVKTAEEEVKLAELQKERSEFMEDYYSELLSVGLSTAEIGSIAAFSGAQVAFMAASSTATAAPSSDKSFISANIGQALSSAASILSQMASYARRAQEWQFQRGLASWDVKLGSQGVKIANSRLRVSGQELRISEMQADFADDSLNFLENKFTNTELYEWMSGVLSGVYMSFLQMATSMAKAAQDQLAFERQETPMQIIKDNYWDQPQVPGDDKQPQRLGLTGSARLLQDIYQLDQTAFDKDVRKNELSKTFSLASLNPVSFAMFRDTGILKFSTPIEAFDRDFPGQYLRLIKKVKTSIIALIPPTQGIKAKLIHGGISTVQVKNNQAIIDRELKRLPESVTLTSPNDSTGMFEMQSVSAKLNPFEGSGVAVNAWEFQMPKPANNFDFNTIADVLITIEYTSLDDGIFRSKLIKQFNNDPDTGEQMRMYSFRNDFADQWYELSNKINPNEACSVSFETLLADIPPNVKNAQLSGVAFYFSRKEGITDEIMLTELEYTPDNDPENPIEYIAANDESGITSVKGRISSKDNTGSELTEFQSVSIEGTWQFRVQDTKQFNEGNIEDIIFVLYYSGDTTAWPKGLM
ncbi:MAG TPA: neuraminidase-like domain-containing protein [Bacteroidia bacterium]|nr:neuraminidase-like domain-containing protein [Bacteroidia bacterium]